MLHWIEPAHANTRFAARCSCSVHLNANADSVGLGLLPSSPQRTASVDTGAPCAGQSRRRFTGLNAPLIESGGRACICAAATGHGWRLGRPGAAVFRSGGPCGVLGARWRVGPAGSSGTPAVAARLTDIASVATGNAGLFCCTPCRSVSSISQYVNSDENGWHRPHLSQGQKADPVCEQPLTATLGQLGMGKAASL